MGLTVINHLAVEDTIGCITLLEYMAVYSSTADWYCIFKLFSRVWSPTSTHTRTL